VQFLTIVPASSTASPAAGAVFFPLIGAGIGAAAGALEIAAGRLFPPAIAALFALLFLVAITGALHEDGLADVADALGAHTTRERRLEILKDPRVGTFGALALILTTALTATSVAALDTTEAVKTLIVAHVLARAAILPVSRVLPPAKPGGAGALLRAGTPATLIAVVIGAAIAVVLAPIALAAAIVGTVIAGLTLKRGLGGITGDGYGATAKLTELAVCLTLCAWWT